MLTKQWQHIISQFMTINVVLMLGQRRTLMRSDTCNMFKGSKLKLILCIMYIARGTPIVKPA